MAVSRQKKEDILAKLEQDFKSANSIAFTTNTKLTVEEITSIRRELIPVDAKYVVAKKTLIKMAFKNIYNLDIEDSMLPNQISVLFSKWDKIAGLAVINKFAKEFAKEKKIEFVGGYFDEKIVSKEEITTIANLPSREVLLAKLLGSMMSPLSALARFFDAAKTDMEAKWAKTVADLASSAPKKEEAKVEEVVEAAPVVEETPAVEATEEVVAPAEETTETPAE